MGPTRDKWIDILEGLVAAVRSGTVGLTGMDVELTGDHDHGRVTPMLIMVVRASQRNHRNVPVSNHELAL